MKGLVYKLTWDWRWDKWVVPQGGVGKTTNLVNRGSACRNIGMPKYTRRHTCVCIYICILYCICIYTFHIVYMLLYIIYVCALCLNVYLYVIYVFMYHICSKQSPWILVGRTDAEAETPVFWSSDVNSWLIGTALDAGKDWGQKEKRGQRQRLKLSDHKPRNTCTGSHQKLKEAKDSISSTVSGQRVARTVSLNKCLNFPLIFSSFVYLNTFFLKIKWINCFICDFICDFRVLASRIVKEYTSDSKPPSF